LGNEASSLTKAAIFPSVVRRMETLGSITGLEWLALKAPGFDVLREQELTAAKREKMKVFIIFKF